MGSSKTLSNPAIKVNSDGIAIIPNSLEYKKGAGDRKVLTESAGGSAIDIVVTEDAETKKSMVKFKLRNTEKNIDLVDAWIIEELNTINVSEGSIAIPFRNMAIINEPLISIGSEGELELEWEGSPVT